MLTVCDNYYRKLYMIVTMIRKLYTIVTMIRKLYMIVTIRGCSYIT